MYGFLYFSGWKPHRPVAWKTLYPSASKKAIDLLGKMLIFDPRERISAEKALAHLFVNKYHDPYDEPICIPVFNFDFEKKVSASIWYWH